MAHDWGLYTTILGTDILLSRSDPNFTTINNIPHIGKILLSQLINKWHDRNNTAYNQILLCISPELQTAIDHTDEAAITWKILTKKFESTNLSKISIIRTCYENYHMVEGQSVVSYLTSMKEFRTEENGRKYCRLDTRSHTTEKPTGIMATNLSNDLHDSPYPWWQWRETQSTWSWP